MTGLLLATMISTQAFENITINVNKVCAAVVGIPYASDNFTKTEWTDFQNCVRVLRSFDLN